MLNFAMGLLLVVFLIVYIIGIYFYFILLKDSVKMTLDYGSFPYRNFYDFFVYILNSSLFLVISFGLDAICKYFIDFNMIYINFFSTSFYLVILAGILLLTRNAILFFARKNAKDESHKEIN
ncbi:hypothetical protein [Aliarcobacter butzleri]|uniref:hypothetical protein n=1 Tax=Aliarcobacter butzleri TaxID=28197 RepID=UPI001269F51B|nr:hypothetical protein [Aliarcobacter butzleri]